MADPAGPITDALAWLGQGREISADEAAAAVEAILSGDAPDVAVAAFLTALRVKGETADEVAGAVRAVRGRMTRFEVAPRLRPLIDTCGTGGDGAGTVNISTAAAVVVAARGVRVAKHGNRAASGRSGSAEVLAALGVDAEAPPEALARCLDEAGLTFLYAPRFHPALKALAPIRRALPFRTLFNLVGPLANPADPEYQLLGVPTPRLADLMAGALVGLGVRRAAVVTGCDGLDEVTLAGPTRVLWVEDRAIREQSWRPEDFGLPGRDAADLRVSGPEESADRIRRTFSGEPGPVRDVILANAAAALLVADRVGTLGQGVAEAARAIDSGEAARTLDRLARLSRSAG